LTFAGASGITVHDVDFQEGKRCKSNVSNDTSLIAKKSTKPTKTSAAMKLPPKAMLTRNFFMPLRTSDKEM
jgi:hypothetical protein